MTEEGAVFRSYVDGTTILLSPELSIETQRAIGSDIMMALDQCVASTADDAAARAALEITHRWAARSLAARGDSPQALFGIVQGALFDDLRRESADRLSELPFDGFAIGGLAVGESKAEREDICELTARPAAARSAALPHGRRHAARSARSGPSRRRHVRLHHPDAARAAGRRLHLARLPSTAARRLQARRGAARSRLRLPDLRALLARLSASPDQDERDRSAGSCSASTTSTSTTSSCARSGEHPGRHFRRSLSRTSAPSCTNRRDNPALRTETAQAEIAFAGQLRGPHRPGGLRQHPADFLGRDHACRTPPMEEARSSTSSSRISRARLRRSDANGRSRASSSGTSASARPPTRWRRSTATKRRPTSGPVRPMHLVSFENDLDSLRLALRHDRRLPLPAPQRPAGIVERGVWHSKAHVGLELELVEGDFLETVGRRRPARPDFLRHVFEQDPQ